MAERVYRDVNIKGRQVPATAIAEAIADLDGFRIASVVPTRWYYDGTCPDQYRIAEALVILERQTEGANG